jgi:hypothetical protein
VDQKPTFSKISSWISIPLIYLFLSVVITKLSRKAATFLLYHAAISVQQARKSQAFIVREMCATKN